MIDWDKVRIFRSVAKAKSVVEAASNLGIHQSVVSRHVTSLENDLGTKLFHRHARGIILTEQGSYLLEASEKMAKQMNSAQAKISDFKKVSKGNLNVTTTHGFGNLWIGSKLPYFFEKNPEINIHLILDEKTLDLAMREADVAIRMKEPSQADLIRRKLRDTQMGLYCSKSYAKNNALPKTMEDLENHRLISQHHKSMLSPAASKYIQEVFNYGSNLQMFVNNYLGVYQSITNDLGIGIIPNYVSGVVEDLIPVFPDFMSDAIQIYLAYSYELRDSKRVMAFRDFVVKEIKVAS